MTLRLLYSVLIFSILSANQFLAQEISEDAKVYLEYEKVDREVNVNARDAINMFESYIDGYTDLQVVRNKEESEFTFVLSVFEKNLGYRQGKFVVLDSKSSKEVYDTGWVKGMPLPFYGYSGTRHAIARAFIDEFLEEYRHINQN